VRKDRRRRRHGGILVALALAAALLGAIYVLFLRPVGVHLPIGALRGASGNGGGAPAPEPAAIDADSASAPVATAPTGAAPTAADADSARQLFGTFAPADSLASDSQVAPAESAMVVPSDRAETAGSLPAAEASAPRDSTAPGPPATRAAPPASIADTASAAAPPADTTRPGSPGGPFVIHLSSFKLGEEAGREVERAAAQGLVARAVIVEVPERGTWYRIVIGDFASFAQAESAAHALQARGLIPYAHIAGEGGRGTPIPVRTPDRTRP
jgi:hypothetical protein